MKRSTRSKFSGAELRDAAKAGNLPVLKDVWETYLEGDVSEKYKVLEGFVFGESLAIIWLRIGLAVLALASAACPAALPAGGSELAVYSHQPE